MSDGVQSHGGNGRGGRSECYGNAYGDRSHDGIDGLSDGGDGSHDGAGDDQLSRSAHGDHDVGILNESFCDGRNPLRNG